MKTFTRFFCIAVLLCIRVMPLPAEEGTITEANRQLRHIFKDLDHPTNFLYERSAHILEDEYFAEECQLVTDCDKWFYAYDEMYNSAKDRSVLQKPETIALEALEHSDYDVPLGIIDYKFCRFTPTALSQKYEYFYFDTLENQLHLRVHFDDWRASEAIYKMDHIFMVSPLVERVTTLHPTFFIHTLAVDKEVKEAYEKGYTLYIDFGDDEGKRELNKKDFFCQVDYKKSGDYIITVYAEYEQKQEGWSYSKITVQGEDQESITANLSDVKCNEGEYEVYENEGLEVFEFTPKDRPADYDKHAKTIFVLSGYNPTAFRKSYQGRGAQELYNKYIWEGKMHNLLSLGYKFVIVDWVYPNDDIRDNAHRLSKLLNSYIKKNIENENFEEFVIIGHSMGCLVGRYALLKMEHPQERWATTDRLHNTRLFISNDGPHQGVNIPMSLQAIYGDALCSGGYLYGFADFLNSRTRVNLDLVNTGLNGTSVQQMLNRHYKTQTRISDETYSYDAHDDYYELQKDFKNLGDYPQYCKLVALVNGSLGGEGQDNMYYDDVEKYISYPGTKRQPNDHLLYMRNQVRYRIFGLKFINDIEVDIRTNPDINTIGLLFNMQYTRVRPHIKVYWFGIKVTYTQDIFSYHRYGTNLLPYCVSAGSHEYFKRDKSSSNFSWGGFLNLGFLGLNFTIDPGNSFRMNTYMGIPWLCDRNHGFEIYTDGLGFGFVPVNSAMDYHTPESNFCINFADTLVTDLFKYSPFDVVIGRYESDERNPSNNNHEEIINPIIYDTYAYKNGNKYPLYMSLCPYIPRRLLNAEIGDESIYLENRQYPSMFYVSFLSIPLAVYLDISTPYYAYFSPLRHNLDETQYTVPYTRTISRNLPYNFGNDYPHRLGIFCNDTIYSTSTSNYKINKFTDKIGDYPLEYDCPHMDDIENLYLKKSQERHIQKNNEDHNFLITNTIIGTYKAYLYTPLGTLVHTTNINMDDENLLSLPILPTGVYVLVYQSDTGEQHTSKIFIQ